jgi:hypothetical protein
MLSSLKIIQKPNRNSNGIKFIELKSMISFSIIQISINTREREREEYVVIIMHIILNRYNSVLVVRVIYNN